jgi:release factor glutamine methyltransferase
VIRNLLAQAAAREQVRLLAVELGAGQAPAVTRLMSEAGFQDVRGEYDLAGIERVLVGERP